MDLEQQHRGHDDDGSSSDAQQDDDQIEDVDNEVSINLEDAIATAEEINSRDRHVRNQDDESDDDDQGGSGSGPYHRDEEELESA